MTLLWLNLAIVFAFGFFARYFSTPVLVAGFTNSVRPNSLLVAGAMLMLVLISGLRSGIGDTYVYKQIYASNDFTWKYVLSEKDIGFGVLQMILKTISDDPQLLLFTAALITNVLIIYVLYKHSRMIDISLYVYITGGLFLVSMNGMRQLLAAAIAFLAIKFLVEGKFKRYVLVIIFASLFHQSALILLPIYFLVKVRAWSKATLGLLILAVLIVTGYERFTAVLFTAIEDTQYADYTTFDEGGASAIRVVVQAAPLFIAFIGRQRLRQIMPNMDIIINMTLIGLIFMLISTQNWIFARMAIYFQLYSLILISWLPKIFREKDQKIIYLGIIVCYFLYYFYENVISLNIIYESDFLK